MKIFDAHCDVLYKMWEEKNISFTKDERLHIHLKHLQKAGSKVQCFAIFVPDEVPTLLKFQTALEMIDIFHHKVLPSSEHLKFVSTKSEILQLKENEIGAMLSLEGCDSIDTDLTKLRTLFRLGVTSVGLTWNNANATADGAMELRGAGLTDFGRRIVEENNKHRIWTDVSHLSEAAFWDVIEIAAYPIASHSNAKALCNHPRNLNNQQIEALLKKGGMIGITFVPQFLREDEPASIKDILTHIDHICALGGEKQIGFGSDFDGIDKTPVEFPDYCGYEIFIERLLKYFKEDVVKNFCFGNFFRHFPK